MSETIRTKQGELTVREAAKILGRSNVAVCDYIKKGLLKATLVKSQWLLREDEVRNFKVPKKGRPIRNGNDPYFHDAMRKEEE